MLLPRWLQPFWPAQINIPLRQRLITVAGAFIGIGLTALICGAVQHRFDLSWWLMAPLGATAAQVFSVPGSPMSQPWPVLAGHVLSALSGLICVHLFGYSSLAVATAVALAVGLMLQARALHPSGGGTALLVVMTQTTDVSFILFPVLLNAVVLVIAAMAWHRLTGHTYPHSQRLAKGSQTLALHRFDPADLEQALQAQGDILDVSRDDIQRVIAATEMNAYCRLARDLTCEQVMSKPVKHIDARTRISAARQIVARNRLKILPVISDQKHLVGAVGKLPPDATGNLSEHMHQAFVTALGSDAVAEILPMLSSERSHVLVIDAENRLRGIISRSDIFRAIMA